MNVAAGGEPDLSVKGEAAFKAKELLVTQVKL
jgi:hypothetical protein